MFDAAQPLFKKIVNILTQPSAIGKILDVHFEYQLESAHDRGMMSITLTIQRAFSSISKLTIFDPSLWAHQTNPLYSISADHHPKIE